MIFPDGNGDAKKSMFRIKSGIPYVDSYVNSGIYYALRKRWRYTCTKVAVIAIAYF